MVGLSKVFNPMKYIGLAIMFLGPWALIYRHFFLRSSYNELILGSLVFLLSGSFLWFIGWDSD
jgi:hypothetical protein